MIMNAEDVYSLLYLEDKERDVSKYRRVFEHLNAYSVPGLPGFLFDTAPNCQIALDKVGKAHSKRRPIDVLLVDLEIPDNESRGPSIDSGLSFIERVLAQGYVEREAILALTIDDSLDTARRALRAGAGDYLVKTEQPQQVLHRVKMALQRLTVIRETQWLKVSAQHQRLFHAKATQLRLLNELRHSLRRRLDKLESNMHDLVVRVVPILDKIEGNEARDEILSAVYALQRNSRGVADDFDRFAIPKAHEAFASAVTTQPLQTTLSGFVEAAVEEVRTGIVAQRLKIDLANGQATPHNLQFADHTMELLTALLFIAVASAPHNSTIKIETHRSKNEYVEFAISDIGQPLSYDDLVAIGCHQVSTQATQRATDLALVEDLASNIGASVRIDGDLHEQVVRLRAPVFYGNDTNYWTFAKS